MWPRLTDLEGPKHPLQCQRCGGSESLSRWQEHDDHDRPEIRVVVLCKGCSDAVVEPHPRLYRQLSTATPFPGTMAICVDCQHRDGVSCKCPDAQINGGPGLKYDPMPTRVHVCRRGGRGSGWEWWGEPITSCSGKVAIA